MSDQIWSCDLISHDNIPADTLVRTISNPFVPYLLHLSNHNTRPVVVEIRLAAIGSQSYIYSDFSTVLYVRLLFGLN